ncbi:MAG: phosphomethylpyrimidine synthase ThiC, partial [Planctomycetota bacterium]
MSDDARKTSSVSSVTVTTGPLPGSRKVYVRGQRFPDVRVPMREIRLTPCAPGEEPAEGYPESITLYDTSGPYTDPEATIDVRNGLPPLRLSWIRARGDVEAQSSAAKVEGFPASARRTVLRAKPGANVTQLHYARQGIITPEMEFVAIRE